MPANLGFTSVLDIGGIKYDTLSSTISFNRETDMKGRPSSVIMGGTMSFTVEVTDKTLLVETMVNDQNKAIATGNLSFFQSGADAVLRKFVFENAYIVSYGESYNGKGSQYICNFTISAEKITVDDAKLDHRWPVLS